ncbi:MAG: Ppx/GppA family phosphatase [Alphaproteobacteria bacterium]|nr:Ppx/GppA family phosphatase [Alphaproteobacteria bacterium]
MPNRSRKFHTADTSAAPVLAALDLGTNNCRLLVARPDDDGAGFAVIDSFSRIVRLGEGLIGTCELSERAMGRTVAALKTCARMMQRQGVNRARCVATEACRRAANGAVFLERVTETTGIDLDVLTYQDEIGLALLGCVQLIDPTADHVLLVDIGGGSTELAWLDRSVGDPAGSLRCVQSLPVGVVSLTEMFSSEPDPATFERMVSHVAGLLAPIEAAHRLTELMDGARLQMLGTSGTVTTLAAVLLDLPRYDRRAIDGLVVDMDAMAGAAVRLRGMSNGSRTRHPCIGPGRADLVVAGCAILEAICDAWPADSLRVADRGLREGILHSLMGRTLEAWLAGSVTPGRPQAGTGCEERL